MHKSHRVAPAKLFIPGSQSDELSYTFVDILPSGDGCRAIFGAFQVRSTSDLYHNVIGQIVKNYKGYFESAQHTSAGDKMNQGEFLFENALQYTSSQVTHHLREVAAREGKNTFDARRFSLVLGLIWDNALHICSAGKQVRAFYLYPSKRETSISHYALVDILEGNEDSADSSDVSNLFSQVISGSVGIPESTLIVCNQSFLDYISTDQIKQAVTSYSNERLTPHFQNLLGKANVRADFSALFLKCTQHEIEAPAVAIKPQTASHESVQDLISTEKGTETILSPALGSQMKEVAMRTIQSIIIRPALFIKERAVQVDMSRVTELFSKNAGSPPHSKVLVQKTTELHATISSAGAAFWQAAKIKTHQLRKKDRQEALKEIADISQDVLKNTALTLKDKFLALSNTSKALLVVSCLLLGVFVISVFSMQVQKQTKQAGKDYALQVQGVEQKTNLAEASLIYDDEQKARDLIAEAEADLEKLPQKTGPELETYNKLKAQIEVARRKVSKMFLVTAKSVVTLENQIPTLDSLRLTGEAGNYVLTTRDGVYTLDLTNGKVLQVNTQAKIPEIRCAAAMTATIYYVCAPDGKLFAINLKDQTVSPAPITLIDGESISLVATYNNRVYVLDNEKGTLTRHNKSGTGFGSGTSPSGPSKEQLTGAQFITIDGSINILDGKGQLVKVTGGEATTLAYPAIEPALSSASRLWTSTESAYYYFLDSSNNRIVVVDKKTNRLKGQITSDRFTALKDLVVNEKKKEVIVLNGTEILSAPLDFFEQK